MKIIFLLGGTGNQLFQFARSNTDDVFSDIFVDPRIRKIFGHTNHESILKIPSIPTLLSIVLLPLVLLEILLSRLCGRTVFSEVDLRFAKGKPLLSAWLSIGYFQHQIGERSLVGLLPDTSQAANPTVAVHIRGGDLRGADNEKGKYGRLTPDYYGRALAHIVEQFPDVHNFTIFTDDPEYARTVCEKFHGTYDLVYNDGPLEQMISGSVGAQFFVSSNSTLAYWISRMRESKARTIVPEPFNRAATMALDGPYIRLTNPFA